MTINGSAGLYIPDQRQVEAAQRVREEADCWRSVAMNREPEGGYSIGGGQFSLPRGGKC